MPTVPISPLESNSPGLRGCVEAITRKRLNLDHPPISSRAMALPLPTTLGTSWDSIRRALEPDLFPKWAED